MAPFLTLFVVISALAWPTHQKIVQPDACKVTTNPFYRQTCGTSGATRDSCMAAGCCFVESKTPKDSCPTSTNKSGACYFPANCEAGDPKGRIQCGWDGINRQQCNCRGCCYDNTKGDDLPACFQPYSTTTNCDWEEHDGKFIVNNNQKLYTHKMSLAECKQFCLETKDFQCNSYEFKKSTGRCSLSKLTMLEAKHMFLVRESADYVTYSCKQREPTVIPECKGKNIDLLFVVDESSSIKSADFDRVKEFAMAISEKLHMSTEGSRVGFDTFAQKPETRMKLYQGKQVRSSMNIIKGVSQNGGSTYTHIAIKNIMNSFRTQAGGRDDAIKVAIVQTDGKSIDKNATKEAAADVRARSVKLIAFGVGDFDETEIRLIASSPKEDHSFKLKNFHQLNSIVDKIIKLACSGVPPEPLPPQPPRPDAPEEWPRFCKDIPPVNRTRTWDNLYTIDPDGPDFGAGRFRVECDFTKDPPETIIHNNQEGETCGEKCDEVDSGCFVTEIVYQASLFQTSQTTVYADRCRQYLKYDCVNSAIGYRDGDSTPFTWWTNKNFKKMNYWAEGPKSGGCKCALDGTCANGHKCNCDARDGVKRTDEGTITDQTLLPIREVMVGDISSDGQQGCFRLGPLICV